MLPESTRNHATLLPIRKPNLVISGGIPLPESRYFRRLSELLELLRLEATARVIMQRDFVAHSSSRYHLTLIIRAGYNSLLFHSPSRLIEQSEMPGIGPKL
jgi:hypothetical protein